MWNKSSLAHGVLALGLLASGPLLAADCPRGTYPVDVSGKGNTNQVRDALGDLVFSKQLVSSYPLLSLGTITLASRQGGFSLSCGLHGVLTELNTTGYPIIKGKFATRIVCPDHSELQANYDIAARVDTSASCGAGDYPVYIPENQPPANKSVFRETGEVTGVWGIFTGASGSFRTTRGVADCGLINFDYRGTFCLRSPRERNAGE